MNLPPDILKFLNKEAGRSNETSIKPDENLFKVGALDSFSLFDLVSQLETALAINISETEVTVENFQSVEAIERFLSSKFI